MVTHHLLDSLAVLPHLSRRARACSTSAAARGCPGIPLALARPRWQVTLLDSSHKKAAFLQPGGRSSCGSRTSTSSSSASRPGDRRARFDVVDLARVLRSRAIRRSSRRGTVAPRRRARRDEGRVSARGARAAARRLRACATCVALDVPGLDAERHLRAHATASVTHDAHPRDRQPERRRRQDDDRGQPRREPRARRSGACCSSISIRRATRRSAAASTSARSSAPSTRCCSASATIARACACARRPAASTWCRRNRELAGAEVELVDARASAKTRAEALRCARDRRRRVRLHPARLPAVADPADA